MKMAVFSDVVLCSLVETDERFKRCLLPPSSGQSETCHESQSYFESRLLKVFRTGRFLVGVICQGDQEELPVFLRHRKITSRNVVTAA
jgi:hypothetical protein